MDREEELIFKGVSVISIDAKGRVAIPAKHRAILKERCAGQLVLTMDRDRCLLLYPATSWETIERQLLNLPSLDNQARFVQRLTLGYATECVLDAQGRVLLPPALREAASLDRQAVLLGQGRKFELWDQAHWTRRRDEWMRDESNTQSVNEALGAIRL